MGVEDYRDRIIAEKRADALAAARAAFAEHGYARTTMAGVAKAAGLSTATLYKRFPSKADLFAAVMRDAVAAHMPETEPDPTAPLVKAVREIARAYAALLSTPDVRAVARVTVAEAPRFPELAEALYAHVKSRLHHPLETRLAKEAEAGRFTGEPIMAAGQLFGMIEHGTLLRGLILGDAVDNLASSDEIAEEALATFFARWGDPA